MHAAVILFATIAAVHCGSVRVVRQLGWNNPGWTTAPPTTGWESTTAGWGTEPPTTGWPAPTTPGWVTDPPTTAGWSPSGWTTQPPPTGWPQPSTAGWSAPGWSPPGWGAPSSSIIDLNAALAAAGSGWAAENHGENVVVTGAGGWGPNAQLSISAGGESVVAQEGTLLQVTDQDSENASSANLVSVGQVAAAVEGELVEASGLDITNNQSGWAGAAGEGASAAEASSSILDNQIANLGMVKP